MWREQLSGLAEVVAPDLPGHGETAGPGRSRIDEYAAWVVAFCDAAGLDRVVLGGHSMGGAGAFHLGVKHAQNWAAIAAIAPAAFSLQPDSLADMKDMPVILIQGDADTAVPVENTRRWAEKLKELKMTHEYKEIVGGDHGNVISGGMPDIFQFFANHSKPAS